MAYDREEVLKYHIGGKVAVSLPKPLKTKDDLCLAYTPGVAHAVKAIAENKDAASLMGIPSQRMYILAWAIGGACAGIASATRSGCPKETRAASAPGVPTAAGRRKSRPSALAT